MKPPAEPVAVPTQFGFSMVVAPREGGVVEQSIYRSGTYESGVLNFIARHLWEGDSFVDVGANVGMISIFAAKRVGETGHIFSFEPVKQTADMLRDTIAFNRLSNIKVFEIGLSNSSGRAPIFVLPGVNRGGSSLHAEEKAVQAQDVQLERLDTLLSVDEWRTVRIMKVDVEGWELEALQGAGGLVATTGHAPILIVEYTAARGERARALYDFLKAWPNSKIYKLPLTKRCAGKLVAVNSSNDLPKNDNIFVVPRK